MSARKNKQVQQIDPAQLDTYFKQRMYALGITDTGAYTFKQESLEYHGTYSVYPYFAETKEGHIQINYPCLYGGVEVINGTEREFFRIRYHKDKQPDPSVKYFQEKKSGVHIFFPPGIIKKYAAKTKIKTLIMVEGEFKAFAGELAGLDIIGLGGKDLFRDEEGDLHEDIQKLLRQCDVDNLVLLLDADLFHLAWNKEDEPYKDLSKRLYNFYNTVKRFREVTKGKVKDTYFSHVHEMHLEEAKGLDDLLQVKAFDKEKIVEDLLKLAGSKPFFKCRNLNGDSLNKLKDYFYLNYTKNLPAAFYSAYQDLIGDTEFNFGGARFQNVKGEGLKLVKHVDSEKYIRVGCDYFKIVQVPNSKGVLEQRRIPWKKGEINMDYVQKGYPNFMDTIEKYDAFCNLPNNTDGYQKVINNCFNLYYEMQHKPEPGEWPNIQKYLKHVFGDHPVGKPKKANPDLFGAEGDEPVQYTRYDLALDILQLKYLNPTQKLPILCLVNREKNTGKSTFLWFMREIFHENATVIGNQEINDQYNDDWASKAVIGIDEGFIDKKIVMEKIKSQSTNDKIKLRGMYAGRQDVSFFGWFILTSNDERNFITIDSDEIRFWVIKVPTYKEEDPNLLKKMIEEIPYFLYYLAHRKMIFPQSSRFWFHKDLLETETLREVKENSKGWFAQELKEIIIDKFFYYKYHTLYYTLSEIFELLNGPNSGVRFRKGDIRQQLQEKFGLTATNARWQHPAEPDQVKEGLTTMVEKHGRCFEFRIEDFLTRDEIENELGEYIEFERIAQDRARPSGKASNDISI